jgi:5-methylcytosine-specific restriction endonuclease McrA
VAKQQRPSIPVGLQVEVFCRDGWLCHLCRRPVILHLALKHLARLVGMSYARLPLAYWDPGWSRHGAPLLDELAASLDHVKAFSRGGAHDASNFAAVCARCNARKSASGAEDFLRASQPWRVKGKYGEPTSWDGLSSVFVALVKDAPETLTATERQWLVALQPRIAARQSRGGAG